MDGASALKTEKNIMNGILNHSLNVWATQDHTSQVDFYVHNCEIWTERYSQGSLSGNLTQALLFLERTHPKPS
jgi:hypothetical protein